MYFLQKGDNMNKKNTQRYEFYSALLKTIACTRNNAIDDSEFQVGVLEPAKAIRELETSSNEAQISETESLQALNLLNKILTTKKTPNEECNYLLKYIEDVSGVPTDCIRGV